MTDQDNTFETSAIKKAGRLSAIDFVINSYALEGISLTEDTNSLLNKWANREISTDELLHLTAGKK